ncbi:MULTISPECIES: LL-diaminopimelate aminotransferase [Aneurinibacillus]|uniref:Aminotransferase n=1 Tax=Aneurinibacillus thermoaerophilus TaxID=143495 RepID=A0A1G8CK66_ANETH|nr:MULTISPECIES: LL-diaminopimelate aminotransferase [Aneurinibacillus]AMA71932.1 LL-diaminopimelate aminotransferase [Aneurinibacillus sp. XH2]MED0680283.1 LL-diaminopimelate aminotransferase [Aneurinibacillus thermoaerophilus]MED0737090.1 LL-diaminopimelate aminotransferase [Aneurinibacillus thermoaerophilus]MED0765878.1 LL-diaminopimelate aminotransferase [Aneurinibacillus thermoaerophilus]QYY42300.1 LL-diaminopimelate aminotransferase [Aneurinibacillus thermoaerophilus]
MERLLTIRPSRRLQGLTSAIFTEMNRRKKEVEARGVRVIDLGIGSPDQPPPPFVIEALTHAVQNVGNYGYPTSEGSPAFRKTVVRWYQHRFSVELDPEHEVLSLMGSQDGLAHLAQAWVDPGDIVLVPDPGYPIYFASVALAGGEIYPMPLREENDFLPDFSKIPDDVKKRAKLMVLNYPNNPVTAIAKDGFFAEVVSFAKENQLIVAHDLAYSELAFDGYRPPSFLMTPGAKEVGVEFNSLSKSFNMAGCRVGYLVGNRDIIRPLAIIKSNIDYGVFLAVQEAAVAAMEYDIANPGKNYNAAIYKKRRDVLLDGLRDNGWTIPKPQATMFVWARVPDGWTSETFAFALLEKAGVVVIPGNAFGAEGEGYVRIALVKPVDVLKEVILRIKKSGILSS